MGRCFAYRAWAALRRWPCPCSSWGQDFRLWACSLCFREMTVEVSSGLKAWFTLDSTLFPFLPFKTTFITSDRVFLCASCLMFRHGSFKISLISQKTYSSEKPKWLSQGHTAILGRPGHPALTFFHAQCSSCSAREHRPEPWPHFHVTPAFLTPRSTSWLTTT